MDIVKLMDVREQLKDYIRSKTLIPLIGAGFTKDSNAKTGSVPDADAMKAYIIDELTKSKFSSAEVLKKEDFKDLCGYYKKKIERAEQVRYFSENFTEVELSKEKKEFLKIDWPYLYTLNIDDAVEENSKFTEVVMPFRKFDEKFIASRKVVYKVHGDAKDYCKYVDSKCFIFDFKDYIDSMKDNQPILKKFSDDYNTHNILLIGCSFISENDIFYSISDSKHIKEASRFMISTTPPDDLQQSKLEDFRVTHYVIVESYTGFYQELKKIENEIVQEKTDPFADYLNPETKKLGREYQSNLAYLTKGECLEKTAGGEGKRYNLPYYFIDRTIGKTVLERLRQEPIQFVFGSRISGKTLFLLSLKENIANRNTYFFDSSTSLARGNIIKLLEKDNSVLLFDSGSIDFELIEEITKRKRSLAERNINIVFAVNKSDKDSVERFLNSRQQSNSCILANIFDNDEIERINRKMSEVTLPNFDKKKTLLDNVLNNSIASKSMLKANAIGDRFVPAQTYSPQNRDEMLSLILLVNNYKISSSELALYKNQSAAQHLMQGLTPMVDIDYTTPFERDSYNFSTYKLVANASLWLYNTLGNLSNDAKQQELIVKAYRKIVETLLIVDRRDSRYVSNYYKFDKINDLFSARKDRGSRNLIIKIYDALADTLCTDPHYFLQRAKCYLWLNNYGQYAENDLAEAKKFAVKAKHDMIISNIDGEKDWHIAQAVYTLALINFSILQAQSASEQSFEEALNSFIEVYENEKAQRSLVENKSEKTIKNFMLFCQDNANWSTGKIISDRLQLTLNYIYELNHKSC